MWRIRNELDGGGGPGVWRIRNELDGGAVTVAAMRRPPAPAVRGRRRLPAVAGSLALGVVLALAACSSGDAAAPSQSPTEQLTAAKKAFDAAKTVQLDLSSRDAPPRENGVTAAKGAGVIDVTEPKFQGTITGTIKGLAGTIEVIAIGETAYLKFFTPDYKKTDLNTLNAPNPAMFFDPATGISALLPQTANPKADGQTRSGQEVLTKISGTPCPARPSRTCSTSATAPAPST